MGPCTSVIRIQYKAQVFIQPKVQNSKKHHHQKKQQNNLDLNESGSTIDDGIKEDDKKKQSFKKEIKLEKPDKEYDELTESIIHNESKLNKQTYEALARVKQQNNFQNNIQNYFIVASKLTDSHKYDLALELLETVLSTITQLKQKGISLYIQDEVELLTRLAILQAPKSLKYQQYLKEINEITSTSMQYFFQDKITLMNNLALVVQQSNRKTRYQQSLKLLQQSLHLQQKFLVVKDDRMYYTKINLASVYYELKELGSGFKLFEEITNELHMQTPKNQHLIKIADGNFKHYLGIVSKNMREI